MRATEKFGRATDKSLLGNLIFAIYVPKLRHKTWQKFTALLFYSPKSAVIFSLI